MSYDDCQAAVEEFGEGGEAPLEISPLSLGSVVEHLTLAAAIEAGEGDAAEPPMQFELIPPSASTKFISSYVGKGMYARVVDEEGGGEEGGAQ